MIHEELEQIKKMLMGITPEPWSWGLKYVGFFNKAIPIWDDGYYQAIAQSPSGKNEELNSQWSRDARFMAEARTGLPRLIKMLEEARQEIGELLQEKNDLALDLDGMIQENTRLRLAIRRHRTARGHDRCWQNDLELYAVLGEEVPISPEVGDIPLENFIAHCYDYYEQQRQEHVESMAEGRHQEADRRGDAVE